MVVTGRSRSASAAQKKAGKTTKVPVNCAICNQEISESPSTYNENSLECECCIKWFHVKCVNLDEEDKYNAIVNFNLHWYCTHCEGAASKLFQNITSLKAEQLKLREDLTTLSQRLDNSEAEILRKVTAELDNQINTKVY